MANFDTALCRHDGHQAEDALHLASGAVDHAEKVRVTVGGVVVQPGIERAALGKRPVGQVVPEFWISAWALEGVEQIVAMARRVEFFQVYKAPFKQLSRGRWGAFPVGEGGGHAALLKDLCEIE